MLERSIPKQPNSLGAAILILLPVVSLIAGCPSPSAQNAGGANPPILGLFSPDGSPSEPNSTSGGDVVGASDETGSSGFVAPNLEYGAISGAQISVEFNTPDPLPPNVEFVIVSPPAEGTIGAVQPFDGGARVSYSAPANFIGVAQFSYMIRSGEQVSDIGTVRIGVHPDVRFESEPAYEAGDLALHVQAYSSLGAPLPNVTYVWTIDGESFSGPRATHADARFAVAGQLPGHAVSLSIIFSGMSLAIPCARADGSGSQDVVSVPARIAGRVLSPAGVPLANRDVRATGTVDHMVRTDANGDYEVFLDPGWNGSVFVDEIGVAYSPSRYEFRNLLRNYSNREFATRNSRTPAVPPTALSFSAATDEEQMLEVQHSGAASGAPISFEILTLPQFGDLIDVATGSALAAANLPYPLAADGNTVLYQPRLDFAGSDSYQYWVRAGLATSTPATVALTVNPLNDPPRLSVSEVSASTGIDTPVTFEVSARDVDAVGSELRWSVSSSPAQGSVVLDRTQSASGQVVRITYTPASGYLGEEAFVIRVADALGALVFLAGSVRVSGAALQANAGPDREVAGFQLVQLSAAASRVLDGTTYEWRQTAGRSVSLANANSAGPTFRAPPTLATEEVEFELTLRHGAEVATDRVRARVNFDKQAVLYAAHAAIERWWQSRVDFTYSNRTLSGYPSYVAADQGFAFYGDESGSACDSPIWNFQGRDGTGGVAFTLAHAYTQTQNRDYQRKAEALGDALLEVQDALGGGWYQDGAFIDGQYRNVGVWGSWGNRRHPDPGYQNLFTLDDSTSQSCAIALLRLYEATGKTRFLDGAKRFGDVLVALRDVTHDGVRPYQNGGIPQVLPFARGLAATYNHNADSRNPDGPYMVNKTNNDNTSADAVIFLSELYRISGETRYVEAVRLNVDYLLGRHGAYGYRGWAQQYHWRDDRIAWGRPKEPPAFVTCENRIVEMMLLWRQRETDAGRRTQIENSIERYLNWLRTDVPRPANEPDKVWRYYNHDPSTGPINEVVFAADYQRFIGANHDGDAEGGQPYRGRWDLAWIERLYVANDYQWDRANSYLVATPNAPIGVTAGPWQPSYESQAPTGGWPGPITVNGVARQRFSTSDMNNRIFGLYKRAQQLASVVRDADCDGFDDSVEAGAGTDPHDSASRP